MKKLLLLLLLLCAFSANASATSVEIATTTLNGFSPSNIGTDRTASVSVTSSSATVTCSSCIPSAAVGLRGLYVDIGGVSYQIASVASTSSMVLSSSWGGATSTQTMTFYKFVEIRIYALARFLPLGDTEVIQPGTPGGSSFYRRYGVSVRSSGALSYGTIPSITIHSTTDATVNNQARYFAGFYRPDGSFVSAYSGFEQFALPPTTPTTWAAILTYNSPAAVVPPANEAYTKTQIDARFGSCTANQLIYAAATGDRYSCLTLGSGLSIASGTITAAGGAGSPGGASGTVQYNNAGAFAGATLSANFLISAGAFKAQGLRGAINAALDYGATGDGVTNDTVALTNAITAGQAAGAKEVYIPGGTYIVSQLVLGNDVRIVGDGKDKTIIKSTGANNPILYCSTSCSHLKITGITVEGTSAGASQDGIQLTGAEVAGVHLRDIVIKNVGGRGLWINSPTNAIFSSAFENIDVTEWNRANTAGTPAVDVDTNGPNVTLRNVYVHNTTSTVAIGYRFRRGATRTIVCDDCNGIDPSGAGSVWAIVGQDAALGDAAGATGYVTFRNSNIEAFTSTGIEVRGAGSVIDFDGAANFTAGGNNVRPIWYRTATSPNASPGLLGPQVVFANGDNAAVVYTNSQPIHSNGYPPLILAGPAGAFGVWGGAVEYYDTAAASTQPLRRLDVLSKLRVTASTTIASEGVHLVEVNHAAPVTITLRWPGYLRAGEWVVVKDFAGVAAAQNITINTQFGATLDGAASKTIDSNYGSLTFYSDGTNYFSFATVSSTGVTGSGTTPRLAYWSSSSALTSVASLEWDSGNNTLKSPGRFWAGTTGSALFPAFAFTGDSDSGLYNVGANSLGLAVGGAIRAQVDTVLTLYPYGAATGETGTVRLFNLATTGSVSLRAHDTTTSYNITFPSSLPAATYCLQMSATGAITTTGSACGSGGGGITSLEGQTGATQTFTDDTNVTIVSAADTHVITWAGTLAKARQNAATVYNDAANTWSTGAQDFGSATSLKVPTSAGAAPTASGLIAYDSTANAFEAGVNGANKTFLMTDGSGAALSNVVNSITGTANQVIASAATGAVTLSLPQSIATASTPQFAALGLGVAAPTAGLLVTGRTLNTDADATVGAASLAFTVTKNDTNTRAFPGAIVSATLNTGASNTATTIDMLGTNTTNTAVTGLTVNLLNLKYGGTSVFRVASTGAMSLASGVRQQFMPTTTTPGINIGTVATLPGTCTQGDQVMLTTGRSYECFATDTWSEKALAPTGSGAANQILGLNNTPDGFELKALTVTSAGLIGFPDGVRQTFNPNGTNAGFNAGSQAGDPSAPSNGDIWYDSTGNTLDARINGATVSLGAGFVGFADGSAGAPGAYFTSDTDNGLFRPTTNIVGMSTAGTERWRVDASGRTLFGRTLSAVGTVAQFNASLEVVRESNTADLSGSINFARARGTLDTPSVVADGDTIGTFDFRTYNGTNWFAQGATFGGIVEGSSNGARIYFGTTDNSATPPISRLAIISTGNVQLANNIALAFSSTTAPEATADLLLRRAAAASLQLGTDGAAVNQTFKAHNASGSNIAGANLSLAAGASTGTGRGGFLSLQTAVTGASGTTVNTYVDRLVTPARKPVATNNVALSLFNVTLPTLTGVSGRITYTVYAADATDVQVRSGIVRFSAVNKAAAYTSEAVIVSEAASLSAGTLTATWTITTGSNQITLNITPNSSLTATTYWVSFSLENNSEQAITIL